MEPDVARAGRAAPIIAWSVVDFPAPFGPIRPTISPCTHLEREAANSSNGSEQDLERRPPTSVGPVSRLALVGRRFRRGRPPPRRRWRGSRRRPPASVRPWSSTWIRSQTSMIRAMLWSIRSTPAPWSSRTARMTAANLGTSASGRPAAGSSISTKRGSVASARATPSRRSSPCGRARRGRMPRRSSPSSPRSSVARAARLSGAGPDSDRSDLDVLPYREVAERSAVLERAGDSRTTAPVGPPARHVAALELDGALVREVEARDEVDERRLPRAVRADQPDDLVAAHLDGDVLEGAHSGERPRDAGGPECSSGPPTGPCDCSSDAGEVPNLDLRDDLRRDRVRPPSALVVLDLDHAVRTTRDGVQLRREGHEPRSRRDLLEPLHLSGERHSPVSTSPA